MLKTVSGVTQMVLTHMVGWAGCSDDEVDVDMEVVSHSVGGELGGTSTKTVVVDSVVIVTMGTMTWLSVLCSLGASRAVADGLVVCCTISCEARSG